MPNLLIGVVVLAWLLVRQLTPQSLRERSSLAWILLAIGVVETGRYLGGESASTRDIALLVVSAAIGAALAVARAYTIRLWRTDAGTMRQGNVLTAVLWLVSLGQHLLLDSFAHDRELGSVSLLAYFGFVLLVQRAVLLARAREQRLLPVR